LLTQKKEAHEGDHEFGFVAAAVVELDKQSRWDLINRCQNLEELRGDIVRLG
jgi:hypothetical protein